MKAVFVVNGLKHWIPAGVVETQQEADELIKSYVQFELTPTGYDGDPIPLQSHVVELPAIADLRS